MNVLRLCPNCRTTILYRTLFRLSRAKINSTSRCKKHKEKEWITIKSNNNIQWVSYFRSAIISRSALTANNWHKWFSALEIAQNVPFRCNSLHYYFLTTDSQTAQISFDEKHFHWDECKKANDAGYINSYFRASFNLKVFISIRTSE